MPTERKAWNLSVEVGCRGFVGQSLWRTIRLLGIGSKARKQLVANIPKQTKLAFWWIWIKQNKQWQNQHGEGPRTP